jgi:hypothetical protein
MSGALLKKSPAPALGALTAGQEGRAPFGLGRVRHSGIRGWRPAILGIYSRVGQNVRASASEQPHNDTNDDRGNDDQGWR